MSQYSNTVFLGPNYKKPKGGISSVMAIYAKYIDPFIFIPTYDGNNGRWGNLFLFGRSVLSLVKLLVFRKNIDKVHIHGSHGGSVYRKFILIFITQRIFNRKVIYHLHSSSFDSFYNEGSALYKYLCNWAINNSNMVITLSNSWFEYYNETFQPKKLRVLNNVIDYPEKHKLPKELKPSALKILFLGEIGERKGIYDLLKVIEVNKEVWDGKVIFQIGGNGAVSMLQETIITKGISSLVEYIGWVDNKKKINYLNTVDAYILPSYNEGLPISILEAMSYHLPIISTNIGGIPEIISHGENGYLIAPGDLQNLIKSIEDIVFSNEQKRRKMGLASQNIVAEYYPKTVFENLINLYKEI